MNEDKKRIFIPQKIGMVFPYHIQLDLSSSMLLDPKKKTEKFPKTEWSFDPSTQDFTPGFGKAHIFGGDIVYVEYMEIGEVKRYVFGMEVSTGFTEKRCKIFDMLGNKNSGIILLHPNYITKNKIHIERYLNKLGYKDLQIEPFIIEENVLRDVFSSQRIEKKGIKFKENSTEIEFLTSTNLEIDEYYKTCVDYGIEKEEIEKIRIKLLDLAEKRSSSEVVIYKDCIIFNFSLQKKRNWNYVKTLLKMLKIFDFEDEYKGDK